MRHARLLLPILLALTAAACAQQKPAFYVTDAATGQRIATAQQGMSGSQRGLLEPGAPQGAAYNSYASAQPKKEPPHKRGLFSSSDLFSWRSAKPAYAYRTQAPAYPTQAPQTYSYQPPRQPVFAQPPQQQAYAQQPTVMQYHPPQPIPQTQPAYAPQQYYHPPQPRPAGYYAERYRWY